MTDPTPEPVAAIEAEPDRPTRYALYDDTLEQFVSGVVTSKSKLAEARKAQPKDHQLTIREV